MEEIQRLVRTDITYKPEEVSRIMYDERYRVYRGLYDVMKPVMSRVGKKDAENIT